MCFIGCNILGLLWFFFPWIQWSMTKPDLGLSLWQQWQSYIGMFLWNCASAVNLPIRSYSSFVSFIFSLNLSVIFFFLKYWIISLVGYPTDMVLKSSHLVNLCHHLGGFWSDANNIIADTMIWWSFRFWRKAVRFS